jgi:hypothetical protein
MKRHRSSILVLLLFLGLSAGCTLFQGVSPGTLVLKFQLHDALAPKSTPGKAEARSIVPSSPWLPQSYLVSGTGPDGAVFSAESSQTSLKQKLAPGTWTIEVQALASGGTAVASGMTTCDLEPSLSTQASVTLCPLSGKGSLNLSIELNFAVPSDCKFSAKLTYVGRPGSVDVPTQSPIEMEIPTSDPRISCPSVEAGQYTLSLILLDGQGSAVGGCFETILVLAGYETSGSCLIELGMPEIDLAATLLPYAPLEAPILSVPCLVSSLHGFRPIARSAPRMPGQAAVSKTWYVGGMESAAALPLLPDGCIAMPENLFTMEQTVAADGLNRARYDFVETCQSESRVGSASTSADEMECSARGGFTWWASFDSRIMHAPALSGAEDMCSGSPPRYRIKAVSGSPSGLVVISGLDEEGAIHALAAPYGAVIDPASGTVPLDSSWIRLWKDKIKVNGSLRTADKVAISRDGLYVAAASSSSSWLRLYFLGYGGQILATNDTTAAVPGLEGMNNVKALDFFQEGLNELLFALCTSSKRVMVFDVQPQGLSLLSSVALDLSGEFGSLSLQDLKVLDSGKVVVSASEASKLFILGDGGAGYRVETIISRSGTSGPNHPGPLARSPSAGGFYALCDKSTILRYEPSEGSAYALTETIGLSPSSTGATTLSSGKDPSGTRDLIFAAGGETAEFIDPRLRNPLLDEIDIEANPSRTDGISTSEGSCYMRGAFILGGGSSGYVSVFGVE